NTMTVSDYAESSAANDDVKIDSNEIDNFAGPTNKAAIEFDATGGTMDLSLDGSNTLPDSFTVMALASNVHITLIGEGGVDKYDVGDGDLSNFVPNITAFSSAVSIQDADHSDQLVIDDQNRAGPLNDVSYEISGDVQANGQTIVDNYDTKTLEL